MLISLRKSRKRDFNVTKKGRITDAVLATVFAFICNSYYIFDGNYGIIGHLWLPALLIIIFAGRIGYDIPKGYLKRLNHGVICLQIFYVVLIISAIWHIIMGVTKAFFTLDMLYSFLWCFFWELIIFWVGIIYAYLNSIQLGLKHRLWGLLMGMIPVINLVTLVKIIRISNYEVELETEKLRLNERRAKDQVCKTKYPILMVHGVFFRDYEHLNYWGRIPKELEKNGATIFYGNHSSALAVEKSAQELKKRVLSIIEETGAQKVNIIAHSKGGLDSRAMIALDMAPYVASLTTINTPHRGCVFVDYLLTKAPQGFKENLARVYNKAAEKLGDIAPDFLEALNDLSATSCKCFNDSDCFDYSGVYCQSVGSVMKGSKGGRFPLNVAYPVVKHFDGEDDGLVSVNSFEFGENYIFLRPEHKRGISHADVIDLNRENIRGFDVREFYVGLVSDLKNRGL